jgi:hypothetical protein
MNARNKKRLAIDASSNKASPPLQIWTLIPKRKLFRFGFALCQQNPTAPQVLLPGFAATRAFEAYHLPRKSPLFQFADFQAFANGALCYADEHKV